MCLILLSYKTHPTYRLILASNRDEFHNRPTMPLAFWEDKPDILAGRDLSGNGTWLGITRSGRLAGLTNFREPERPITGALSRGLLVSGFLDSHESPEGYLARIGSMAHRYNGFNLLVGDATGLYYYSNREHGIREITPGIHGLSNHLLNTAWPKLEKGKRLFHDLVDNERDIDLESLFDMLNDRIHPPDDQLPDTGVGPYLEFICSPIFVTSEFYGTRSSSILLREHSGRTTFVERTFALDGGIPKATDTRRVVFHSRFAQ
ncbi:MAG: NRDE family protein [Gammaproteobacteria bacterium]|nr:NRDE family protein [Gammaproteobacteria bacterium]